MRNKLGILLTFTSIFALFGCDKWLDESGDLVAGPHQNGPGCESESEYLPHPYLSCRTPEEWPEDPDDHQPYDPACFIGCGGMQEADGTAYSFCAIECEDASDCAGWDPGDSVVSCAGGRCNWYCDEDHACPSELECVGRGDLLPDEEPYWGQCWAPDLFGSD
jgi:hypothetical protein